MARDAGEVARLSADAMWRDDKASQGMGMEILEVRPGYSRLGMTVVEQHAQRARLLSWRLHFLAGGLGLRLRVQLAWVCPRWRSTARSPIVTPGRLGMRLLAEAQERQRGERSGIYDVTVRDETGTVIAEFRGHSRTLPGSMIDDAK